MHRNRPMLTTWPEIATPQSGVTVHALESGSFFGRLTLIAGQTSSPKNVPDPFVC